MTDTQTTALDEAALALVASLANTSRAYGVRPGVPEMVPIEIALRLAEKAYRRGVTHGAEFMMETVDGGLTMKAVMRAGRFSRALSQWRERGRREGFGSGDFPPDPMRS